MVRGLVSSLGFAVVGVLGAQTCTLTVTATPQSFPIAGGDGVIVIDASSNSCPRPVTSNVSWITISFGQIGNGDGRAGFTVARNNDAPSRTGTITVGSQTVTITQAGPPCNFAINPNSANISAQSQTGSLRLTGLAGCPWTASSNASWLQVTSAVSGTGPATIGYSASANTTTTPRIGVISVAGFTFTVNQAGVCAYTLNPASLSFSSAAGNGTFTVNSGAGCAWTATSSASWIRLTSGQTGTGTGQVGFAVESNTGDARTATISLAGQTFTVTQASLSCSFTLTPGSATVLSSGGTATFSVSAPANCSWTAVSTAAWITIVSGASGSGTGVVGVSASANPDSSARTGTVAVGGQAFTVTQSGSPVQAPGISIVNAASRAGGAVSPGMVVVIAAPGIGPADTVTTQLRSVDRLATQLGETRVLFDGVAAPMVYAASGECGAIVPYEVAGKNSTQVQVEFRGVVSNSVTVPVVQSSPGIFSLGGSGAILDALGNRNSADNPAPAGSIVVMYATGEGQTSAPGIDGRLAVDRFPQPILPVGVTMDGIDAEVIYAGAAPGLAAGVIEVIVRYRTARVPALLRLY